MFTKISTIDNLQGLKYLHHQKKKVRISSFFYSFTEHPASMYMFKINIENTKRMSKFCSKLTITTPERRQGDRSSVFAVNFERIS